MKSLVLALSLVASISAFASTSDEHTMYLTGAQTEENFVMNTIQTRTEYRNETVAKTCWRTVPAGYQTVCRQEPETFCYSGPDGRPYCSTRYVNRCYTEMQYRQEAYTCYQTISVPYEVFNNNVKANVNVKVVSTPGNVEVTDYTCGADFTLEGAAFSTYANCPQFIVLANKNSDETRVGDTVIQTRSVELTLLDAQKLSAPTKGGIAEMRLEGQTLVFRTGDLTKNPNFSLKLFVERRKLLKGDETLINRNLAPSEYSFEKINEDYGIVKVNLSKLIGGINRKRKHILKVDLNVIVNTATAINRTLPSFSASESIKVND